MLLRWGIIIGDNGPSWFWYPIIQWSSKFLRAMSVVTVPSVADLITRRRLRGRMCCVFVFERTVDFEYLLVLFLPKCRLSSGRIGWKPVAQLVLVYRLGLGMWSDDITTRTRWLDNWLPPLWSFMDASCAWSVCTWSRRCQVNFFLLAS